MNNKRFFLLSVILLLLVGCDRAQETTEPANDTGPAAESADDTATATAPATRPASGTTILADGQLVAVNPPLPLSFSVNGRLLDIQVEPGDLVSAGDLIATLDDETLNEAVTDAELQVSQAEIALAQAQLALDELLNWEPDEMAVALAEANLAAAEASYENALTQDAAAANSLISARIGVEQAQRALADAQEAYDQAWQEARDWELNIRDPSCLPGQGGPIPCTGPPLRDRLENEREATARALPIAQESLDVAQANYSLALAGLNDNSALSAEAAVVSAQQTLELAQTGPKETEIRDAQLTVAQSELSLEQAEFSLNQARQSLEKAKLYAPWNGAVLSVDVALGAIVGSGTPVVTLQDTKHLVFHTSNLSERDLAQVQPDQAAIVTLKAFPNDPLNASVLRIGLTAEGQVGDAAVFPVIISLPEGSELDILPGMTGRVEIRSQD